MEPTLEVGGKVTAEHLKRKAYLYIRQSSMRQIREHQESTKRQYDLQRRAIALGWAEDEIIVIDDDLGQSAASSGRAGFSRLVSEVGLGYAGMVISLEASRLARNNGEWHRLLEICAFNGTLLLDEDGIYDPSYFNDRLLLGLKGTMSEVELHLIRARLNGGRLNKAARGELKMRLPIGLVYDLKDRVVLDPDQQVEESLRVFFKTYHRTGSVHRTVKEFRQKEIRFPRREHSGPRKGELTWGLLDHNRAAYILHNPRYAGAYVYRRRKSHLKNPDGKYELRWLPQNEWHTLIKDAHPGYISWDEYDENQKRLQQNRIKHPNTHYPPREGAALLQGIAVCGQCGRKMTVRYNKLSYGLKPRYECAGPEKKFGASRCQTIPGDAIDQAIGQLLVETMTPLALEVTLAVQEELRQRMAEADQLRHQYVERIHYETDLAKRRYLNVVPENRLVADSLEAEWNQKLVEYREAKKEYECKREEDIQVLDDQTKTRILGVTGDFEKLWHNPQTPARERKRMVRLLIEDVTLIKDEEILLNIRFKGGAVQTLHLPKPKSSWERWQTDQKTVKELDRLLNHHTYLEIAAIFNKRGVLSGQGHPFDGQRINKLRRAYGLKSRYQRLREQGYLTAKEAAVKLGISASGIRARKAEGRLTLKSVKANDMDQYLYEDPDRTAT